MDLLRLRDRLSFAQALLAVAATALGGVLQWWSLAAFVVLTAWAYRRSPRLSARAQRWWTFGIALALVLSVVRAFALVEFLDAGIDFLLLLVVQRFFNRARTREHLQLLLLGALVMVVAAVVHTGVTFPILLVAYLLAVTLSLIVNQVVAEGERLGGVSAYEASREAARSHGALVKAAVRVTLMAALGAVATFVFFPRWGAGVFLRGAMAKEKASGFSGQVQLGEFGRIKTDPTVVARLRLVGDHPRPHHLPLYLRGSSLDHYDGGQWQYGLEPEQVPLRRAGMFSAFAPGDESLLAYRFGYRATPVPGFDGAEEILRAVVTLEDLGVDVLFAAAEPLAVSLSPRGPIEARTQVRAGRNRELRVDKPPGPVQYEFISRANAPSPEQLRAVGDPEVPEELRAMSRPFDGLSPRVTELAHSLTRTADSRYARVEAIAQHLRSFAYTLELDANAGSAGVDPVERFLFESQAGHCEYFATALAALVRELGIPARIVNGFYGARYNAIGDFYTVRQADAHAWVEVHFGALGWVTLDATPPAGREAADAAVFWPSAWQVVDAVRNAYLEYVIDYNLTKQWALFESVRGRSSTSQGPSSGARFSPWLIVTVPGALGLAWVWRRRRRRVPPVSAATRAFERLARASTRAGHPIAASEPAATWARRLSGQLPQCAAELDRFQRLYDAARFGDAATREQVEQLHGLAKALARELRRHRSSERTDT